MKIALQELLAQIPGPVSENWPDGQRFAAGFAHGTMSVELYAPLGTDPQTPHAQDELYFVMRGSGELVIGQQRHTCNRDDVFFVAAGVTHRFENFSDDFASWVVFWGPQGGEA